MPRSAVQLYVFRDVEEPLPAVVDRVAEAGFEGVEFAYRFPDADVSAVADALDRNGVEAAGAHVRVDDLEDDPDGTVERYRAVDCGRLIVPSLDEAYFEDRAGVEEAAGRLEALAGRVDATVGYHNHTHEWTDLGGRAAFGVLIEATDDAVEFQLDVDQAAAMGYDPAAFLDRYGDRIASLHADLDVDADALAFDLAACLRAARERGVEWIVHEGGSDDPFGALPRAMALLDSL